MATLRTVEDLRQHVSSIIEMSVDNPDMATHAEDALMWAIVKEHAPDDVMRELRRLSFAPFKRVGE